MGTVKEILDEAQLEEELAGSTRRLVVVDYTATWCGPCQRIAPIYQQLALKYPQASFLKVDVDKCQEVAAAQHVSAMPTFHLYRNRVKVDSLQGADHNLLEQKISRFYDGGSGSGSGSDADLPAGHMDLSPFLLSSDCEALNESDSHTMKHCLTDDSAYLESDCDEQLILSLAFNQAVKIHSLRIKAPADSGPKDLRLFINQTSTLDFDSASSNTPVQELTLTPDDLSGEPVLLRYVKFQNVMNIQLFIKDNQSGSETTRIDHLQLIGSPILTTNMADFKRVAGKKGEAH